MAKRMSKETRENVITGVVLGIILILVGLYVIYPLITLRDIFARPDRDKFEDINFELENDPAYFVDLGLNPDTFKINNENIYLACLYFKPDTAVFDSVHGSVVLIPPTDSTRTFLADFVRPLLDSGLSVILYDQRASGLTGGQYHSPGVIEAGDLNAILYELKFDGRLKPPVSAIGFKTGADAAILASQEEDRIDQVLAIGPDLTATRWLARIADEGGIWKLPFYKGMWFWWYTKFSSYPYPRTTYEDIQAAAVPTVIIDQEEQLQSEAVEQFIQLSGDKVSAVKRPENRDELKTFIIEKIYSYLLE